MTIDKNDILKYVLESCLDESVIHEANRSIDEAIKSLGIEVKNNKIKIEDAHKIVEFVKDSQAENENDEEAKNKNGRKMFFWSGIIVASGLCYGGYELFLERYSIEQEYALISTCVGEHGSSARKQECIKRLKQCLKDDKKAKECEIW